MNEYTYFEPVTGEIKLNYFGGMVDQMDAIYVGFNRIDGHVDHDQYYIIEGEAVLRQPQSTAIDKTTLAADGVDVITITGAPADAVFTARNIDTGESVSGTISDPDTFSTVVAGTIRLKVEKFPFLTWEATINAV